MDSFRFAEPQYLNFLFLLPVYWMLIQYLQKTRRKNLSKAFGDKNYKYLSSSYDPTKAKWRLRLEIIIFAMLILALARPQTEGGTLKVKNEGIEILFVVDVSRSMLAEDLLPSRLEVAKRELIRMVNLSEGDRFGLAAFAGSAVLLSPMTTDRGAINMYIESLGPDTVSTQGTDFGKALDLAYGALKRGGLGDDTETVVTRAVLIASDGEDHQKEAIDLAKKLAKDDIRIFTIAFGTEKGGPIPVKDSTGQTRGYVNDGAGKTVLTQLNPATLKELAKAGDGSFHHFTFNSDAITSIRDDLKKLQKSKFSDGEISTYDEKYQWFLGLGLFFSFIYLFLGERKSNARIWRGRFEAEAN